ncbi:hypothetical protein EQ826_23775 [Ectopseudomonas mendocina]|nr:hypothetical protein EQ828_17730 [Pseudomonas mendocina]TRO19965.1 hypothetical protein EQ826_23775 [Pseudomonas mendocina]
MQVNQKQKQSQGNPEKVVIPAQAGIQNLRASWAPAFAGVTINDISEHPEGIVALLRCSGSLMLEYQSRRRRQTPRQEAEWNRCETKRSEVTAAGWPVGRAKRVKGLSGMDAARAAMGQGWPFVGGPHPVVPLERRWSEET